MKHCIRVLAAAVTLSSLPDVLHGQDEFTLTAASSKSFLAGEAGEQKSIQCVSYLLHVGTGAGAGGWSFGVAVEGATVTSATLGQAADTIPDGGFRDPLGSIAKVHVIDPAENGGVNGAVTGVTLTTQGLEEAVLPKDLANMVLVMELTATIPVGGGAVRVTFRDGLTHGGETFPLAVTQEGVSVTPDTEPLEVTLLDSCCDHPINVGFSTAPIRDGPVFEDIVGAGATCAADEGEIVVGGPEGVPNTATVYLNIVSNLAEGHVQGWELCVALDGAATITSATIDGTAGAVMPAGYRDPEHSLHRTQVIDPAKNGGQQGVVSNAALTTGGLPTAILPSIGTQTTLKIQLASAEPQGAEDQVATLQFQEGLVGSGLPLQNYITVDGQSVEACNFDLARVRVVFRKSQDAPFRRGDSNGDDTVNISDIIFTLNALFSGGTQPTCDDAADANDNGATDISDPVFLVNHLFSGTEPAPPSPGPLICGPDPTEDDSGCSASSCQ